MIMNLVPGSIYYRFARVSKSNTKSEFFKILNKCFLGTGKSVYQ